MQYTSETKSLGNCPTARWAFVPSQALNYPFTTCRFSFLLFLSFLPHKRVCVCVCVCACVRACVRACGVVVVLLLLFLFFLDQIDVVEQSTSPLFTVRVSNPSPTREWERRKWPTFHPFVVCRRHSTPFTATNASAPKKRLGVVSELCRYS